MSEDKNNSLVQYEDDNDEEYEVEEEELTSNDNEAPDTPAGNSGSTVSVATPVKPPVSSAQSSGHKPALATTLGKPASAKVIPSEEVAAMEMLTPEILAKRATGKHLPEGKNPFPSHGRWTETTMSDIRIRFPILNTNVETTNELTRKSRPEARYWRAPVTFSFDNYTSDTLRFDNVEVPFHTANGYGSNFVYVKLPAFASEFFQVAGREVAGTRVSEPSLEPDSKAWWKVVNKLDRKFGVLNNEGKFIPKSLETIFNTTRSGIRCSVVLNFLCKCSTQDLKPLTQNDIRTVGVELARGFILDIDVNVDPPARTVRNAGTDAPPPAIKNDIAQDSVISRLNNMGI